MGRQDADLLVTERLEMPRRGKMARPPLLRDSVEYATSRMRAWTKPHWPRSGDRGSVSRIRISRRARARRRGLEDVERLAADRRQGRDREGLAEDGGVLEQRAVGAIEGVEPGGDERVQRSGTASCVRSASGRRPRRRARAGLRQRASGRSRRHTAGCHRHGRGSPERRRAGSPGTRPASSSRMAGRDSGWRDRADEVRAGRRPSRAVVRGVPAGRGSRHRSVARRPVEEMVDEVEQAGVGPVQVLEHQMTAVLGARSARRTSATPRTAPRGRPAALVDARAGRAAPAHPPAFGLVGHVSRERRRDARAGRRLVVALGQAGAAAGPSRRAPRT